SFDHRYRFVGNVTYQIPDLTAADHAWLRSAGSGWRINGIVTLQSGAPFTVNLGTDRANIGSGAAQRADALCDPNEGAPHPAAQWFNTSCFALPAPFTFGSAGRNTVFAPGYADVDLALAKAVRLANAARLELRWEVFNLFDRANFDVPNRTFGTSN